MTWGIAERVKVERILDIGGGLSGVNIHLSRHYGHAVGIDMLDRVGMDRDMKFGFRESTEKYNEPELAKAYMKEGGMPIENFTFWDADADLDRLTASERQYDVIMSHEVMVLLLPVFHLRVLRSRPLGRDGVMIVDVRRDQDQQAQIEKAFDLVYIAHRDHTLERLVLRRKS